MINFDSVFVGEYSTEAFANNKIQPAALQKRDVWTGYETARQPVVNEVVSPTPTPTKVYRGVLGGSFVFNNGSPPVGATDIVIVAEIFV